MEMTAAHLPDQRRTRHDGLWYGGGKRCLHRDRKENRTLYGGGSFAMNFNELGTAVLHHSLRAEDIILIR